MASGKPGIGLKRLQHLVLWVSDVERSIRFYRDVLGFEVTARHGGAVFLKIPGSPDDHHLGLFEQTGVPGPEAVRRRPGGSTWKASWPGAASRSPRLRSAESSRSVVPAATIADDEGPERRG